MEPTKPPLVLEAERLNADYLKRVVAPFVLFSIVGSLAMAPAMPLAVNALGEGMGVSVVLIAYLVGLAALMVPLIKKGMEIQWTKAVLGQWALTQAQHSFAFDAAPAPDSEIDPRVASARQMASRVQSLLEADQTAGDAAMQAADRADALLAERDSVLSTLDALPEGDGRTALEDAAGQLEAEAERAIDALANLYAAVAAQRAAMPAAADRGITDALARLHAEAEVAGRLLTNPPATPHPGERARRAKASKQLE
jgi:hypothetical protein